MYVCMHVCMYVSLYACIIHHVITIFLHLKLHFLMPFLSKFSFLCASNVNFRLCGFDVVKRVRRLKSNYFLEF